MPSNPRLLRTAAGLTMLCGGLAMASQQAAAAPATSAAHPAVHHELRGSGTRAAVQVLSGIRLELQASGEWVVSSN